MYVCDSPVLVIITLFRFKSKSIIFVCRVISKFFGRKPTIHCCSTGLGLCIVSFMLPVVTHMSCVSSALPSSWWVAGRLLMKAKVTQSIAQKLKLFCWHLMLKHKAWLVEDSGGLSKAMYALRWTIRLANLLGVDSQPSSCRPCLWLPSGSECFLWQSLQNYP